MKLVRDVGDVHGVVVRLHLDFDGLEWLVEALEEGRFRRNDLAVIELREVLEEIRGERVD